MKISSRSGIIILFATVTVCTLVLFPLLQYVAERDPQLSAYDDDWNDISNFRKSLEEDLGLKLDKIENFGNDVRLTFYRD